MLPRCQRFDRSLSSASSYAQLDWRQRCHEDVVNALGFATERLLQELSYFIRRLGQLLCERKLVLLLAHRRQLYALKRWTQDAVPTSSSQSGQVQSNRQFRHPNCEG